MDFGKLKSAVKELVEPLDHACMLWEGDPLLRLLREAEPTLRWVAVPFVPTAEEIVAWLAKQLSVQVQTLAQGACLERLELHETPSNSAAWCRD